jgi:hypothetical protein
MSRIKSEPSPGRQAAEARPAKLPEGMDANAPSATAPSWRRNRLRADFC